MTHRESVSIPLHFSEEYGGLTGARPVSAPVPFAKGLVRSTDELWLQAEGCTLIVCSFVATAKWSDGSIKWCVIKATIDLAEDRCPQLTVLSSANAGDDSRNQKCVEVVKTDTSISVSTGHLQYEFGHDSAFPDIRIGDSTLLNSRDFNVTLQTVDGQVREFTLSSLEVGFCNPASATLIAVGTISLSAGREMAVELRFEILSVHWLKIVVQVHNPDRAQHNSGIWDLGDSGSMVFSGLGIQIKRKNSESVSCLVEPDSSVSKVAGNFHLMQASSGGVNWDSPNHVDADGVVPIPFHGYRVKSEGSTVHSGDRANPIVRVCDDNGPVYSFRVRQFWQNFPKNLSVTDEEISLGLFPNQNDNHFELQGGERKQHEIFFSFEAKNESLDWVDQPVVCTVASSYLAQTRVLRYANSEPCNRYQRLIGVSHCAENGFLAKREMIDEFGWRNFGDIFADHETLYDKSESIFVSHYNNQYDAIYGCTRQYLLTGDNRWYELLDDLSRHVMDIDIYRTSQDRAEYNHGLFWHTDHYKETFTCTHRTYSRQHTAVDAESGGGPGSEHCYTSGLLHYYYITGNVDAREAVLGLTSWIRNYYEGSGTLLEACVKLATEDRHTVIALCKGQQVFRYKYGFDRGVGNYIRALLDSYEITLDVSLIEEAEAVMQNTFSSNDDISARDLNDIEGTWFYSIFLQEVVRYLDLKRETSQLDSAFIFARDALLHYARWMVINETPYLSQVDRLEYPNDTWVAQDIRKANVLYAAYRYATTERSELLQKARYFRDYVLSGLEQSETLHFARIQIIMLQNHGPHTCMDGEAEPYTGMAELKNLEKPLESCFFSIAGFFRHVLRCWVQSLVKLNIKREILWLRTRFG